MTCNQKLVLVEKAAVLTLLPQLIRERYEVFSRCPECGRLYWRGTHWERMKELAAEMLTAAKDSGA
jgi:uncharacterized protein with PIN domain